MRDCIFGGEFARPPLLILYTMRSSSIGEIVVKLASLAAFAAVASLVSSHASALHVDGDGLGQVLLYPYYTVNQNQDTYVTLGNLEMYPVLVHVRFLEGQRGRPALDLDVVLRPHSTWAAAVTLDAGGGAKLVLPDPACTSPAVPAGGLPFTASGYDGSGSLPADDGSHGIERTREGFIEAIAGALLGEGVSGNVPDIDCNTVFGLLPGDTFGFGSPNPIFGSGAIIDVGSGTYYGYGATALAGFTSRSLYTPDWGPLHPSLADANDDDDPDNRPIAEFHAVNATTGDNYPLTSVFENGVDAVSAVLMTDAMQNDVVLDPALGARTDWVVTMPTRRFYEDSIYDVPSLFLGLDYTPSYGLTLYDRSGTSSSDTGGQFPNDVNVLGFAPAAGTTSPVFGSTLQLAVVTNLTAGSARMDVNGRRLTGDGSFFPKMPTDAGYLYGYPMIGFMAYKIVNANAEPGILANYGAGFPMRRAACITSQTVMPFICRY